MKKSSRVFCSCQDKGMQQKSDILWAPGKCLCPWTIPRDRWKMRMECTGGDVSSWESDFLNGKKKIQTLRRYPGSQNPTGCHHAREEDHFAVCSFTAASARRQVQIDKEPVMFYSEKTFIQWIESRQSPCLSPQLLLCPASKTQQELWCWIASVIFFVQ